MFLPCPKDKIKFVIILYVRKVAKNTYGFIDSILPLPRASEMAFSVLF